MTAIIFLVFLITGIALMTKSLIKVARRQSPGRTVRNLLGVAITYGLIWLLFAVLRSDKPVALGTDICFDDWCATVLNVDQGPAVQKTFFSLGADSTWILLDIRMSNHARGIAQKPDEPRIHIDDKRGNSWSFSAPGQSFFEKISGIQIPLDSRLELGQSLKTKLVFAVPKQAGDLKIIIEEGPAIANLLFRENREIFLIH